MDSGSIFDQMLNALSNLPKEEKWVINVGPLALAHIKWLVDNKHLHPEDVSIEGVMAADKKLGITPHDWKAFS